MAAVKALTSFNCYISKEHGTTEFMKFREGDVIAEPDIADELVKLKCPVAPVNDVFMVSCPKCRTVFDSRSHPAQAVITRANATLPYDSQLYRFAAGDVVRYEWLQDALKKSNIPLATVDATECPNCGTLFY